MVSDRFDYIAGLHHRIGDLENENMRHTLTITLHHRIGDLEILSIDLPVHDILHHRIGDLEK